MLFLPLNTNACLIRFSNADIKIKSELIAKEEESISIRFALCMLISHNVWYQCNTFTIYINY